MEKAPLASSIERPDCSLADFEARLSFGLQVCKSSSSEMKSLDFKCSDGSDKKSSAFLPSSSIKYRTIEYFCTEKLPPIAKMEPSIGPETESFFHHESFDLYKFLSKYSSSLELSSYESSLLLSHVRNGYDPDLRGSVWNFVVPGNIPRLYDEYDRLLKLESSHEKQICRDLARTFPYHEFFSLKKNGGQESLFNVMKAYSLFDCEVGYCQGLSFIAGVLLLVMDAKEAFSVLVRMMHHYNLRKNFTPGMEGLHLRLFQFDQILKSRLPKLYDHFQTKGIFSMMYASQWFLTLFAYKYPFEIVFCIFDLFLLEGTTYLFNLSIALLKKNEEILLKLDFEELLEFLKGKLFFAYLEGPNQLVADAKTVAVTDAELCEFAKEFGRVQLLDSLDHFKSRALIEENANLKVIIRNLEEKNRVLQESHEILQEKLISVKTVTKTEPEIKPSVIISESKCNDCLHLKSQMSYLEKELIIAKVKFAEAENSKDLMSQQIEICMRNLTQIN